MDVDTLWIMEQNLGPPSHGDGKKITHVMFGSSFLLVGNGVGSKKFELKK
jgi:hypothetical protein